MNDAELVKKILAGDEERFGEIVDRYARKVWALCASYVHNPSDCEDLVQESFVRSYLRLNTIREPNAFGAWLGQIARTRCLEWLRKRTREKNAVANLGERTSDASTEAPPSESAQREEIRAFVRRNLEALPDKYREALYLFYIGGHSVAEAALFLDISESAMKKTPPIGPRKASGASGRGY
ncbi:MAG: RNA polymerase sigma factor [Candidatus Hydrogenedentota bacterium]